MSILDSHAIAASVAAVIEIAGVAVLVIGGVYSALRFVYSLSRLATRSSAYSNLRRDLGRSILLGLEIRRRSRPHRHCSDIFKYLA